MRLYPRPSEGKMECFRTGSIFDAKLHIPEAGYVFGHISYARSISRSFGIAPPQKYLLVTSTYPKHSNSRWGVCATARGSVLLLLPV